MVVFVGCVCLDMVGYGWLVVVDWVWLNGWVWLIGWLVMVGYGWFCFGKVCVGFLKYEIETGSAVRFHGTVGPEVTVIRK